MRIFITGGSGLIGRHLAAALHQGGHEIVILSRQPDVVRRNFEMRPFQVVGGDPTSAGPWQAEVDGCDVVVNLAGHNIFANRWNAEIKQRIRDTRVYSAQNLVTAIKQSRNPPKVFVHGSAVGFYGVHGDEELDESCSSGSDFLAVVCREGEEASVALHGSAVRRVLVRTGIVLAPGEGAMKLMTPLFKLGPGVPIGSGSSLIARGAQWMSWIHMDDVVGILHLVVNNADAAGPLNGTAPNPVTNAEFAKTFAAVLRKRYTPWRLYLPFGPPDALLYLALGEVATVITKGQRVVPAKLLDLGYQFKYPRLADALRSIVEPRPAVPPPARPLRAESGAHH
jgi:uncharacterized protein (TIGR01777 family)